MSEINEEKKHHKVALSTDHGAEGTSEMTGVIPNRWLVISITSFFAIVQAHAIFWGGLKMGMWSGGLKTVLFNWTFNIFVAVLSCCIVLSAMKHTQKLTKKNVKNYQAYFLFNSLLFSIIVPFTLPFLILVYHNFYIFIIPIFYLILGVAILYMPSIYRKTTTIYKIYISIVLILSLFGIAYAWNVYISVDFLSGIIYFLSELPKHIRYSSNPFQFLAIQNYVPAMLEILLLLIFLPITTVSSIIWRDSQCMRSNKRIKTPPPVAKPSQPP